MLHFQETDDVYQARAGGGVGEVCIKSSNLIHLSPYPGRDRGNNAIIIFLF